MLVKSSEADKLIGSPPKAWAAVLFFGSNAGLVRERADTCARSVVPDMNDAFRVADLAGDVVRKDPARLADEAAAISMFGGRRVVRVRDAGDGLSDTFESLLAGFAGDALVVVEAGELAKTSSLRKLFEGAKAAAAVECVDDRLEDSGRMIRETLSAQGWQVEPEALVYLSDALNADRRLMRTEMEKLVSYLGQGTAGSVLTRAEAVGLIGDSGAVEGDEIADAVADGDLKRLDRLIAKGAESGLSWGVAVGFTLRLFQRLATGSEGGGPMWGKMQNQAAGWDGARLRRALAILAEAEAQTRTTGLPEAAVAQRALFEAAGLRAAGRR
ncbi:MAG: DNA polymerase III subunit delta [Micropepsaceae bacterium]